MKWTLLPGGDDQFCLCLLSLVGIDSGGTGGTDVAEEGADHKLEDFEWIKSTRRSSGTEFRSPARIGETSRKRSCLQDEAIDLIVANRTETKRILLSDEMSVCKKKLPQNFMERSP